MYDQIREDTIYMMLYAVVTAVAIGLMMAPIVVGMAVCVVTHSDAIFPLLFVYYLLLIIGIIIYMVRETMRPATGQRKRFPQLLLYKLILFTYLT